MGPIGYMTAEIGLWSELHTYSGGLGVLAGDHVKSAADAKLPLTCVTLLYHEGYSRQHIDENGIQTESYRNLDPSNHLIDTKIELALPLDNSTLYSRVWRVDVKGGSGHIVPVYFLDTNHPSNIDSHKKLCNRLYGGDENVRIRQEFLLGVGGVRLLKSLHGEIGGLHLNEGHCTFALLELLNQGWSREKLSNKTLFTTHTPVPAGHDRFEWSLMEEVLGDLLPKDAKELVITAGDSENGKRCSLSHLAVALSGSVNAVSSLNADVAKTMFKDKQIVSITNGVHHLTWTSPLRASLFDKYIPNWRNNPNELKNSKNIPDAELLKNREMDRELFHELVKHNTGIKLYKNRLTIGFARRFATYKRANLVFKDLDKLLSFGSGKIQFVFSGKAHPKDYGGKKLIQQIYQSAAKIKDEIPVAFLEDYDMATGLAITSGVDIWLNNPIRPLEASGTSGMKAAMNGVPNCSILDGWWPEACQHGTNGWAIGKGEENRDDERDANNVYNVLENDVLPAWEKGGTKWAKLMKSSIAISAKFTGARMIEDYKEFYEKF